MALVRLRAPERETRTTMIHPDTAQAVFRATRLASLARFVRDKR
jgi:hypothetical protein